MVSWYKSSNYRGKLRCHACDTRRGRTESGKSIILVDQNPHKKKIYEEGKIVAGWVDGIKGSIRGPRGPNKFVQN